jgi:hypothetical protein
VNVSRELFAEKSGNHSATKNKNPLSTITNDESFKFPRSVSEAQERIAKLQNRSVHAALGQENYPRQLPSRDHVQAMKRQVREKISTPAKAPPSRTINIPLNKVNELKKRLEESKMEELKKLESAQMNAKKRAEIKERVNTVQGLLKGLNENIGHKSSTATPVRELNLPRARVSEMKSWLKDFEMENKAHADKWITRSAAAGEGGAYVPRSGARNEPFELEHNSRAAGTNPNGTQLELDQSEGKRVSELTDWLVDFGENNKAHLLKGSARPYSAQSKFFKRAQDCDSLFDEDSEQFQFPDTEPVEHAQDSLDGGESEQLSDTDHVENISMLEEAHGSPENLNVSMMPGVPRDTIDDEDDETKNNWDDEYQDLMMRVDIVQVESGDTWDNESVESPKESAEGENDHQFDAFDEEMLSRDEEDSIFSEEDDEVEHLLDLGEEDEELLIEQIEDIEDVEEHVSENDASNEELSVDSYESEPEAEEDNVLNFDCDDTISKMSFEGQPVDIVTTKGIIRGINSNELNDTNSPKSALFGENILNKTSDPIVSNSFHGHGLSDSMFVVPPQNTTTVVRKKNQSGIRKLFGSLNCMKNTKASRAAKSYANSVEETQKPDNFRQASSKSLFLSPDSHQEPNQGQNSYLPNTYSNANTTNNINGNFAREMLMVEKGFGKARAAESPMSLASAYRRQLSPGSSCVSGFTDVETHFMTEKHDIGQHVKHLQRLYAGQLREPRAVTKSSKLYMF